MSWTVFSIEEAAKYKGESKEKHVARIMKDKEWILESRVHIVSGDKDVLEALVGAQSTMKYADPFVTCFIDPKHVSDDYYRMLGTRKYLCPTCMQSRRNEMVVLTTGL